MKKLLVMLFSVLSFNSAAQSLPWPEGLPCGRHIGVNIDGQLTQSFTQYNWYSTAWREVIQGMATLFNKPDLKLSMEYMQLRAGYLIMKREAVDYAVDCNSHPELEPEVTALFELQKTRKLTTDDFKGGNWIHMVSALDSEEANCLSLSKINGKYGGCGDQWQDGITSDEAVCFKGKTYLKCHVECIQKLYNRTLELKPGFCE